MLAKRAKRKVVKKAKVVKASKKRKKAFKKAKMVEATMKDATVKESKGASIASSVIQRVSGECAVGSTGWIAPIHHPSIAHGSLPISIPQAVASGDRERHMGGGGYRPNPPPPLGLEFGGQGPPQTLLPMPIPLPLPITQPQQAPLHPSGWGQHQQPYSQISSVFATTYTHTPPLIQHHQHQHPRPYPPHPPQHLQYPLHPHHPQVMHHPYQHLQVMPVMGVLNPLQPQTMAAQPFGHHLHATGVRSNQEDGWARAPSHPNPAMAYYENNLQHFNR